MEPIGAVLRKYHSAISTVKRARRLQLRENRVELGVTEARHASHGGASTTGADGPASDALVRLRAGRHPSSMVDRTGRLIVWLLSSILAGVAFARRSVDTLRDAQERGAVVHIMRNRSVVDYVYFNLTFLREGLRLARFANGVNTWFFRPLGSALATLLRGRRGLPDDEETIALLARASEPSLLFLSRPRRADHQDANFSVPLLRSLIVTQREVDHPILVVPQLLVWDKRPDRSRPTLLDSVLGTRQDPGLFKKLIYVVQNLWQSFLNLGQPFVQVSSAIDLREFVARHPGLHDAQIAVALRDHLLDVFDSEQRVIVGPGIKPARVLRDEILADPRTKQAMLEAAAGTDRTELVRNGRRTLNEIAADFNLLAIKLFSALLTPVFNTIYDGIELDHDGLENVRAVARDSRIVLVPSHKSHMDYLVLSYLFYRNGLIPPHIAAGINLSFWPLGPLFRRSGAFFLRRSFAGDPLYPVLFNAYLVKLLEEGFSIEFFIEGTRSRTGKLNPPKYGMLNMIVDAFLAGDVDRLAFVPVSVGYENVIEGRSYRQELGGDDKRSEGITDLLKTPQILTSKYGRVYVEFGAPIALERFLERADEPQDDEPLDRTVRRLAYRIIHGINDVTTVTPSALAALVVLNSPEAGIDRNTLLREAGYIVTLLRERRARMSRTLRDALDADAGRIARAGTAGLDLESFDAFDVAYLQTDSHPVVSAGIGTARATDEALGKALAAPIDEALRLLADKKLIEIKRAQKDYVYGVADDRRVELAYYKNNIVHYFVPEAVFATALLLTGEQAQLEELRERTHFLSRLLKYEYCFVERRRFDEVFERTLAYFVDRGWVERPDDERLVLPAKNPAGVEFLRGLLVSALEGYWLTTAVLTQLDEGWTDEKALVKRAIQHGRQLQTRGELVYPESVARTTIETAMRLLREWEVLEQSSDERGRRRVKRVRVTDAWRGARLDALVADLRGLVARQDRTAGEALRAS